MIATVAGARLTAQLRWQELQHQLAVAFSAPRFESPPWDEDGGVSWLGRARMRAALESGHGPSIAPRSG